jgi:hypothetical protein
MAFSRTLLVALSAAILCGTLSQVVLGDATATLSVDCQDELKQLWSNYTNPAYTISGCDTECLSECKEIIEQAMYVTNIKSCPRQDEITRCFGYFAPQWEDYVNECAIFTVDDTSLPAGSTAEAEGEAGSAPAAPAPASGEAEAASVSAASGEAEAEAPSPSEGEGEAEAEAPGPEEEAKGESAAEAEAEAPGPESEEGEAEAEAEAEAPAPETEEAEAENTNAGSRRRRTLLDAAEAEAAGSAGSGICFPNFKSDEEFTMYIKGEYFDLAYDPPSNTVGIILSSFFWVGLAALGFHLRK